jgi:hypothetical protein
MNTIRHIFSSAPAPAPAPGTKLSYKSGRADRAGDSTVVVLKNGELMEVRRGANTHYSADTVRNRWPTVDAWRATLPAGATITETKSFIKDKNGEENPDFQRIALFLEQHGCGRSWNYAVKSSLLRTPTNAEKIAKLQHANHRGAIIMRLVGPSHRAFADYTNLIQRNKAEIAKLQAQPEPAPSYFLNWKKDCSNALVYGKIGGDLYAIGISMEAGLFAARRSDGTMNTSPTLAGLGFPAYFVRTGEAIRMLL